MLNMQIVKFLCDNARVGSDFESVLNSIRCDVEALGDLEGETFNDGEYNLIDPDDLLVQSKMKMKIGSELFHIILHKQTYEKVKGEELNTLEVEINSNTDLKEIIYFIKVEIKKILKRYFKEVFILTDTQNEALCSQLYLKIHKIENKFREAINNYMLRKFGVGWFKNNIKDEYQTKSAQYVGWYNKNYEDFRDIQSELFSLQTDDLIDMLEKSYVDKLNKIQVDSITDLMNKLGDKAILVINEHYINLPSIWETDIKIMLPNDFKDTWKEFSNMRNMIAHNKPICLKLEKDINDMVASLNEILERFKEKIDLKLTSMEKQEARAIADDIYDGLYCQDAGIKQLQDKEDVIEEIFECEDIQDLYSSIDDYLRDYNNAVDELECCIEQLNSESVFDNYATDEFKKIALGTYTILAELGYCKDEFKRKIIEVAAVEDVKNIIIEDLTIIFNSIEFEIDNIIQSNGFDDNITIFKYTNIFGESIELKTSGNILPESGSSNDIDVKMYVNGNVIEHGLISKSYGEYQIHDDGYALPIFADSLDINISDIVNQTNIHFEETIEKIQRYVEYFSAIIERSE